MLTVFAGRTSATGGVFDRTHGNQLLTNAEEDGISAVIQGFSLSNLDLSRAQIIHMVRDHFKLGHDWRGDSWFAGFLARHRLELHSGHPKAIAEKRTRKEILDYVKRFVSVMGALPERAHVYRRNCL